MTDLEDEARASLEAFMETKRLLCVTAKGPADLPAILDVRLLAGDGSCAMLSDPANLMPATMLVRRTMGDEFGSLRWLVICADAYVVETVDQPGLREHGAGLAKLAHAHGHPGASELLTSMAIGHGSEIVGWSVRYHYEHGQPIFGEITRDEAIPEGRMPSALRAAFEAPLIS